MAVQQEAAARLDILNHVVFVDIGRLMAGYEVSLADIIGGLDRLVAKTQVRNRQAAGFFES